MDALKESTATVQTLPPAQTAQRKPPEPEPTFDLAFMHKIAVGVEAKTVKDEDGERVAFMLVYGDKAKVKGKNLYLVSLDKHKSRVMGPKGAPMMVDKLPIWAAHEGEARRIFCEIYHTGLMSVHNVVIEPAPTV